MAFANTVKFTAGSFGTADFLDGVAAAGFRNLASAGVVNGSVYSYRAVDNPNNPTQWENGQGAYSAASPDGSLARTTIFESSTGAKVDFTSPPVVILTPLKADQDANLHLSGSQTVTGGFNVAPYDLGTVSSGTVTPNAANANYQGYINAGAHTVAMPATDCAMDVLVQNGVAPGAITITGARVGTSPGDAYTTSERLSATATISNASPGVITSNGHGCQNGDPVFLTTSGALPTGLSVSTLYYALNVATNTLQVAATPGGAAINTSSAGSGTHTLHAPSQFLLSIRRLRGIATYLWKALQ